METKMILYFFFVAAMLFATFIRSHEVYGEWDTRIVVVDIISSLFWPLTLTIAFFLKMITRD